MPLYRVKPGAGRHIETDWNGVEQVYTAGEVFDSKSETLAVWDPGKFEAVHDRPRLVRGSKLSDKELEAKKLGTPVAPKQTGSHMHPAEMLAAGMKRPPDAAADAPGKPIGGALDSGPVEKYLPAGTVPASQLKAAEDTEAAEDDDKEDKGGRGEKAKARQAERRDLEQEYGGDFEALKVDDLREIARDEKVELHGASRKDEIIAALRAFKG